MSHEIRTPMNAILGFSEILLSDSLSEEKTKRFLKLIYTKGIQLHQLINDIIDLSKIEAGQLIVISKKIRALKIFCELKDTYHSLSSELNIIKPEVNLIFNYNLSEDCLIIADDMRLLQVLQNLINNALKFTKTGEVIVTFTQDSRNIMFIVQDTGIGISKDMQNVIFERFRQAFNLNEDNFGGTGLGLSIVKNLVELMRGNIYVKSEPGKGSEFIIKLPK